MDNALSKTVFAVTIMISNLTTHDLIILFITYKEGRGTVQFFINLKYFFIFPTAPRSIFDNITHFSCALSLHTPYVIVRWKMAL